MPKKVDAQMERFQSDLLQSVREFKAGKHARVTSNVFADIGFPPGEATVLAMRADLMGRLRLVIEERGWTHAQAAEHLGIDQSRVSDLVRGKWDKFSLDMLITLAERAANLLPTMIR